MAGYVKQPGTASAPINRGHPLARGLVLAGYGTGGLADQGAGPASSWTNNSATKAWTAGGSAWRFDGAATYLSRVDALINIPGGAYSFACLVTPRGSLTTDSRIFAFGSSGSNFPIVALQSDATTASTASLWIRDDSNAVTAATVAGELVLNQESLLIGVVNAAGITLYTRTGLGTNAAPGSIASMNRTALGCLVRSSPAVFYQGDVAWWAGWSRDLSATEVLMLRTNPWQIFSERPPFLWAPAAPPDTLFAQAVL